MSLELQLQIVIWLCQQISGLKQRHKAKHIKELHKLQKGKMLAQLAVDPIPGP